MPINERFDSTQRSSFDPTDETVNNVVSVITDRELTSSIDSNTTKDELEAAISGVSGGSSGVSSVNGLDGDVTIDGSNLNAGAQTINNAIDSKQDILINQTNIKSINGESLLGSGDVSISASSLISSFASDSRPAHQSGLIIIDSDLGYPLWSDGTEWRDFTGEIPYSATVFFSEDFEGGINSWTIVADPSAGTYTNQDIALTGATDTNYNQTYPELSFRGRINSLGVLDDSYSTYKTFSYDAGGGTWYVIINNFNTGDWIVRESSVDPSTFADGTDLGVSLNSEQVVSFSTFIDGESAPFIAGLVSGYSGGTFTATNSWNVGSALSNGGTESVYISEDSGITSSYNNTIPTVTHIYKEFTVPAEATGSITLDFDWKCLGESSYDYLRVFVAPTGSVTPTGGSEVSFNYNILSPTGSYDSSDFWTSASENITSSVSAGSTYKLIFQWKNDNVGGSGDVAIDNVSIYY